MEAYIRTLREERLPPAYSVADIVRFFPLQQTSASPTSVMLKWDKERLAAIQAATGMTKEDLWHAYISKLEGAVAASRRFRIASQVSRDLIGLAVLPTSALSSSSSLSVAAPTFVPLAQTLRNEDADLNIPALAMKEVFANIHRQTRRSRKSHRKSSRRRLNRRTRRRR